MTKSEFINRTIDMITECQCDTYLSELGFKLKSERNNIGNITITTQVLLIFEQLFGNNFMFNNRIRGKFDFGKIIKYLNNRKDEFINSSNENYSKLSVTRCAYCGIGLLLLKEVKSANEVADFLCNHKINNEYAWGLYLNTENPDIISTYVVTMLLNRLHRTFSRPLFLDDLLKQCDNLGIPYNNNIPVLKFIEALTVLLYMDKFYYFKSIDEEKVKLVNRYYYTGVTSIQEAKEAYFKEHPNNGWRIYGFGLAANIVCDLNNPFYKYVLEKLTIYFDKIQTNIPYVLEICRMYNAINRNNDPFHQDKILYGINELKENVYSEINIMKNSMHSETNILKNNVQSLEEKIYNLNEYNREITIKIPIATAFVCMYFIIFGYTIYSFIKTFALNVLEVENFNDLYIVIDLGLSVIIPTIVFVLKKTRMILINLVDKFYKKFNVTRTNKNTSESEQSNTQ